MREFEIKEEHIQKLNSFKGLFAMLSQGTINFGKTIRFLDYEKKEGLSSFVTIKGNLKKDNLLRLDLIKVKAKNNIILIKGLDLSKDYKIS